MNATETVTGTARNTNPIGALRRMSNANVVFTGRARDGHEACSVKTPRVVTVASTTRTLCEAFAERLRLKWHECEAHGQCTVSECRGRIYGGDFAGVVSQTHVVCGFSVQRVYRETLA